MRTLTPPAITAFTHCPYRYQLGYLYKIHPIAYDSAVLVGKGLAAGISQLQSSTAGYGSISNAMLRARAAMKDDLLELKKLMDKDEFEEVYNRAFRDRAKVCAMLRAYYQVYSERLPLVAGGGRQRFKLRPLVNPATGRDSRTFNLGGTHDGVYRLENGLYMLYLIKTTSSSLKEFVQVIAQSIQPQLMLSMVPQDVPLGGICIDIVKKPVANFARPKSRAKKPKAEPVIAEPLQDYEDRCYNDYTRRPEHFFRRILLPVDPNRIRAAQAAAWRIAQGIRDSDRHGYLACRGMTCKTHRGWCDFRSLCWYDNFEDYVHGEFAHDELELAA